MLLCIPKQMENTHFDANRVTVMPMGRVWSVLERIRQILTNRSNLSGTVLSRTKCV